MTKSIALMKNGTPIKKVEPQGAGRCSGRKISRQEIKGRRVREKKTKGWKGKSDNISRPLREGPYKRARKCTVTRNIPALGDPNSSPQLY